LLHLRGGRFGIWADAVEQLCAGDEWHAEAGGRQDQSGIAGIILQVVEAPLDGANRDCVSHQIRLEARLDDKQSADLPKHLHFVKQTPRGWRRSALSRLRTVVNWPLTTLR